MGGHDDAVPIHSARQSKIPSDGFRRPGDDMGEDAPWGCLLMTREERCAAKGYPWSNDHDLGNLLEWGKLK